MLSAALGADPATAGTAETETAETETEVRVAEQVAVGRTNPEIDAQPRVSPRTVQSHVSSILTKLGLTSRFEVAAEQARRTP